MAEEYFKVRKGLAIGEDITIDAATGDIVTDGDIQVGGNEIKSSTGNVAISLSNTDVTVAGDLKVTGNDIKSSTGQNAIFLDGSNVSVYGDITVLGDSINSNTGNTAIQLSNTDVAIMGDLTVVGNDIKSSGGTTAITLSNNDVTIPGDINVANSRFSVTEATNLLRVNIDNIEFYKTNATQKLMDIDQLNSWNFYNDKYYMNYFDGTPLVEFNGTNQTARLTFDNIEFYKTNNTQKLMDIDALNAWDFYNDKYRFNYFNGNALVSLDGTTQTAKYNFDNFEIWNTANSTKNFDLDSTGNLLLNGTLTTNQVQANTGNDITLQGENIVFKTNNVGSAFDQLLKLDGTGYDFAVNDTVAFLVPNLGTISGGQTFKMFIWTGDTTAGSNQITNCKVYAITDYANYATPLDWNTVTADITGSNAKPVLFGNDTDQFLSPNQGYNFQLGVDVSSVTINPGDNTLATVTLSISDLASSANAASSITGAWGMFSEYTRSSDSSVVYAYNAWNPTTSSYNTPVNNMALYTWNAAGSWPVTYPTTVVSYKSPAYWSHGYSVAPTGYFTGRKRINLEPTNPVNEHVNSRFSMTVGPNAVSTNRGLPNDGGDALGISVFNDGSIVGYNGKTAINLTQFKTNSFFQGSGNAEKSGPYFTFNQLSNTYASGAATQFPASGDGMGHITWWGKTNLAGNLSSINTPAGIHVKATEDWNNSLVKSGAGMYLQYTPNSAGAQGGRTWAMADDVTTQLRGGTSVVLKPIAKSGSATSVASIRALNTTVNHTWLTASDYTDGNAFTNGSGAKVTVGITSASGNNGDVGLVLQRATGNTANFEWKLPTGSSNTLQLINNASTNVLASLSDGNVTFETDSYNLKDSGGNDIVNINNGTETLKINMDNIEFYKSNASQKVMDIDALNSWNFYNDKYFMNYFNGDALVKFDGTTQTLQFNFNDYDLKTTSGATATSANINYTRTYGEFAYTAGTITIPAQNTVYAYPLDTTLANSGTSISNTSRINIAVAGWYKIIMSLQASMETNSVGIFDFWLSKNGTAVPNSATVVTLLKDQKAVIAMEWLVESDGDDYWEIMYASSDVNYADIDFPSAGAITTPYARPAAPALIVNVIPAGM